MTELEGLGLDVLVQMVKPSKQDIEEFGSTKAMDFAKENENVTNAFMKEFIGRQFEKIMIKMIFNILLKCC